MKITIPLHEDARPWTVNVGGEAGQSGPHRHDEWQAVARTLVARLKRTTPTQFFAILRSAMNEVQP